MRTLILLFLTLLQIAQAQPVKLWDKTIGGDFFADDLYAMTPTDDGGFLLAGSTSCDPSGDKTSPFRGAVDYWIVRLNANGDILWDKSFGGKQTDELRAMLPTSDGGFLLGGFSDSGGGDDKTQPSRGGDDYWIVRVDAEGNKLWDKTFGGANDDQLRALAPTTDGGFLLAGASLSSPGGDKTSAGHGSQDYWVVRIDASGNKLWDKSFGTADIDILGAMVATHDGGFLLAGRTRSGVDGDKSQPSQGDFDYWVVRLDADGNKLWDKAFGGSNQDSPEAMIATVDGGYLLAGYSYSGADGDKSQPTWGGGDYWLVRLNADGTKLWDKTFGGAGGDVPTIILPAAGGGFIIGGQSSSDAEGDRTEASRGNYDYWAVAVNAEGDKLWDKAVGGPSYDRQTAIGLLENGGYLFGGWSNGGVGGDKSAPNKGGDDFWLVRLGPPARSLQFRNLITRPTTQGQADGGIRIAPYGGQAPYEYSINGGATWFTTRIFTNLPAGAYEVAVRDAAGATTRVEAIVQ